MPSPNTDYPRPTVLVIDDCVAERDLYEVVLGSDFNIITAGRGDDGCALAVKTRPDAIVLDVMMPGLSGWDTCQMIKFTNTTANIPVILLTGSDDEDLWEHAERVGAVTILEKPCPAGRLKEVIDRAMQR